MYGNQIRYEGLETVAYQYTGQEFDEAIGLHNFRARFYDAELGRFYAMDPQGQFNSPYNGLGNNPVMHTDPTGEAVPFLAIAAVLAKGAAISAAGYTASVAFSDGGFDNWDWGQFGKSAAIGAISGAATAGIGTAFQGVGGTASSLGGKIIHEVGRAYAHGVSNTVINGVFGNDVNFSTIATGAFSSLVGAGSQAMGWGNAATIGTSALTGGVSAEFSGGDFWRGAATGATVAGLNHVMHKVTDPPKQKSNNSEASSTLGAASTGLTAAEEVADMIRAGKTVVVPVYSETGKLIAGWRVISKHSGQVLGFIKAGASFGAYATAGAGTIIDAVDLVNGDLSPARFSYRVSGTATSIVIGAKAGGWWGALAGGAVMLGEMAYDSWVNTIQPAMQTAMPTGNWSGFRGFR